jgi:hypothetical protein
VKIVGQSGDMRHQPDMPSRTNAARGAMSRDAGLLRIRTLTKGAAVTAAVSSVALGLVLAHPAQSQAASAPATPAQSTDSSNAQAAPAAPPAQDNQQQQLAPPAQAPAAPQAPPAAVSGGS